MDSWYFPYASVIRRNMASVTAAGPILYGKITRAVQGQGLFLRCVGLGQFSFSGNTGGNLLIANEFFNSTFSDVMWDLTLQPLEGIDNLEFNLGPPGSTFRMSDQPSTFTIGSAGFHIDRHDLPAANVNLKFSAKIRFNSNKHDELVSLHDAFEAADTAYFYELDKMLNMQDLSSRSQAQKLFEDTMSKYITSVNNSIHNPADQLPQPTRNQIMVPRAMIRMLTVDNDHFRHLKESVLYFYSVLYMAFCCMGYVDYVYDMGAYPMLGPYGRV